MLETVGLLSSDDVVSDVMEDCSVELSSTVTEVVSDSCTGTNGSSTAYEVTGACRHTAHNTLSTILFRAIPHKDSAAEAPSIFSSE